VNTYQQYLVADMLTKRLATIGMTATYVMFSKDYDNRGSADLEVSIAADYHDANGKWMRDEAREAKLNEFIELYPDTTVTRKGSYGAPDMLARGVTSTGIAWEINFHSGTCERVQVGTKRVERFDPKALAAIPKITVDEPVYEYVCADPIVSAGLVAS
jgi:hypothetical protein